MGETIAPGPGLSREILFVGDSHASKSTSSGMSSGLRSSCESGGPVGVAGVGGACSEGVAGTAGL